MSSPEVSILIPVYNREKIISETIECAINQTYKNIEIILCDNASTDGTWGILEKYVQKDSRVRIFRNEENVGPVLNWKKCLNYATGKYGKILWSDDLIAETFIEHTLPLFDDDTAFVMTGTHVFDPEINYVGCESSFQKKKEYSNHEYLFDVLIKKKNKFPLSPGCAIFRLQDLREALIVNIPNSDDLDFGQYGAGNDLLMFLIPATKYKVIKTVNNIESFYRTHVGSITNSNDLRIYYEWARFYFVKQYMPHLTKKYKLKLYVMKSKFPRYNAIYNLIDTRINLSTLPWLYSILR